MGGGASCCGGKSTDIVDSINKPLERHSIGVGHNSKQTRDSGTDPDAAEVSSRDSGRVSPSPSTVSLSSVYNLRNDGTFVKSPEPGHTGGVHGDTSDYDSTGSLGESDDGVGGRGSGTGGGGGTHSNQGNKRKKKSQRFKGTQARNNNKHRQHCTKTASNNGTNSNLHSKTSNTKPPNPLHHTRTNANVQCLRTVPGNNNYAKVSENSTDWSKMGPGYRLGSHYGNPESRSDVSRLSHDLSSSSTSQPTEHRARLSTNSYNQNIDALYRLDNNGTGSATSSSGFIGHRPLNKRDSHQRRVQDISGGGNELSVTGQAMGVNGTAQNKPQTSGNNHRKASEAFFLPVESLVVSNNKSNKTKTKQRKKKTGDAFMITFDGNNTTSQPLSVDENDSSGESCDEGNNGSSSHPSSRAISSIGDYSYNLSRSSSRNANTADSNAMDRTGIHNNVKVNNRETTNNNRGASTYKPVNKVHGIPTATITMKPKQPKPYQRPSRLGNVQSWRQNGQAKPNVGRSFKDPYTEINALNQHIHDLRELLAMHMQHQPLRKLKPAVSTSNKSKLVASASNQTKPVNSTSIQSGPVASTSNQSEPVPTRSNYTPPLDQDMLIQKLQQEIVQLENKLCEKEDEIDRLNKGFQQDGSAQLSHAGTQVQCETMEIGTDSNNELDELLNNYERMLTDLDSEVVEQLKDAHESSATEEEVNRILREHATNREIIRTNMTNEKQRLGEKLKQKLANSQVVTHDAQSHDQSEIGSHAHNEGLPQHKNQSHDQNKDFSHDGNKDWSHDQNKNQSHDQNKNWTHKEEKPSTSKQESPKSKEYKKLSSFPIRMDEEEIEPEHAKWRSLLEGISEEYEQGHRVRSNTFTKDDIPNKHTENEDNSPQASVSRAKQKATDLQCDSSPDAFYPNNSSILTQTDGSVDPNWSEIQRLTRHLKHTIDQAAQDLDTNDKRFISDTMKQQGQMSAQELHDLLSDHMTQQEQLEQKYSADIEKQRKSLLQKLKARQRFRTAESSDGEHEEAVEDLIEEMERPASRSSKSQQTNTRKLNLPSLPLDESDLGALLSAHRQQRNDLQQSLLMDRLKQIENTQKRKLQKNSMGTCSTSTDQATDMGLITQSQGVMTQSAACSSVHTSTDPKPKAPPVPRIEQSDVTGVIKEHKDRLHELRQIKEQTEKIHQEKAQQRLMKRLKKNAAVEDDKAE